jgi:DNA-directed RNA polymerase subunit RPC12/RpoP
MKKDYDYVYIGKQFGSVEGGVNLYRCGYCGFTILEKYQIEHLKNNHIFEWMQNVKKRTEVGLEKLLKYKEVKG